MLSYPNAACSVCWFPRDPAFLLLAESRTGGDFSPAHCSSATKTCLLRAGTYMSTLAGLAGQPLLADLSSWFRDLALSIAGYSSEQQC